MRNAERILAAYDEAEPWKADHDTAVQCFEMEEVLAVGNMAYDLVSFIDAAWQDRVARGKVLFKEEDDRRIGESYRKWIEISGARLTRFGGWLRKVTRFKVPTRFSSIWRKRGPFLNLEPWKITCAPSRMFYP